MNATNERFESAVARKRLFGKALAYIGAAAIVLLLPLTTAAEPVTLKLSFPSSDRSLGYLTLVKPFVDAINNDGRGLLKIDVYFSGTLGTPAEQPQLVADGRADIALVLPGFDAKRFPDEAAIELPGLFHDAREASLVHTRLAAVKALRGFRDFFVIGAVGTRPETIHSRKRIASLADLKGQTLRVNNPIDVVAMGKLDAAGKVMSLVNTTNAISIGAVDGAVLQLAQLFDFGVGRMVSHHYLLPVGSAPLALVMNRKVFDSLPDAAKSLIRDHSGVWLAERYIETSDVISQRVLKQLRADPRRTVTVPTPADLAVAQHAFKAVADEWAAKSSRNQNLLTLVKSEIAKLRSSKETRP